MAQETLFTPRARGGSAIVDGENDALPLRAELFSIGQLEHHARTLAGWHTLSTAKKPGPDLLLPRLAHNERMFARAYALITEAVGRGRRITPAAEWFIDNWPLLEEQIRTARLHLPRGYSRELPRLANSTSLPTTTTTTTKAKKTATTPRVYQLAFELVSHSHGRIDEDALHAFIAAYQAVTPLRLGELWAIPIMLRLALLEELRRVVANVTAGRRERERARFWIKKMIEVPADRREDVVLVLAELVRESPKLTDAFVSELATRLQAQGSTLSIASSWLEQRLAEQGRNVAQVFQLASQSQAKDQVSIGNSIGGLRFLSATDWQAFVEAHSVVDIALRTDPTGVYPTMDFATRDRYRHAVEAFARRSLHQRHSELDVANVALAMAEKARVDRRPVEEGHVGYWLIDAGQRALADAINLDVDLRERARRFTDRHAFTIYTAGICMLTVMMSALVMAGGHGFDHGVVVAISIALLLITALSQLATAAVQWRVTSKMTPRLLARLDFRTGIPAQHATLVAVPCMLSDVEEVDSLVEALQLRWLANRDAHLQFALLTDFKDAVTEVTADDAVLLARARDGIARLNAQQVGNGDIAVFLLLHRPRRFNAAEGMWMGHERKRGKLEDLNLTLRGATDRFEVAVGDVATLRGVRYVIALDSDTQLPRDAGRRLVETMAHPLNKPVYDESLGRVVRGYSILQPRVGVSMASAARTRFAQLFAGEPGIDPYTRAVSDVYQDLFSEGSFIGKGIYDVDMLQKALAGRFPDNRVLSHDLLEGAYARCGLLSDVMLIEEQPGAHRVDLSRRSRWVRGDWQIASWLLPRVPTGTAKTSRHALSPLSRWKIADNLRRSVVAPSLLVLLALGVIGGGDSALVAAVAVLAVVFIPGLFSSLTALVRRPEQMSFARYLPDVARELLLQLLRDVLALSWLPVDAALSLGAIVRATVRLLITHRQMLQWRTAADATRSGRQDFFGAFTLLWASPVAAIIGFLLVSSLQPVLLPLASPLFVLWSIAPAWSWWLGLPLTRTTAELDDNEVLFLRQLARRTWRFFEVFCTDVDHHLVPDNFQEDPPQGIAHRTSPTNIGLSLTANLAAFDFGYVGVDVVVDNTTKTLATLDRLPRHRGHFYNWYDTRTLEPLLPLYVSTVDSGNLAGHLITLAAGLDALVDEPLLRPKLIDGLTDTLGLYAEASVDDDNNAALQAVRALLTAETRTLSTTVTLLTTLVVLVSQLPHSDDGDDAMWAAALLAQTNDALVELHHSAPWTTLEHALTPELRAIVDAPFSRRALATGALLAIVSDDGRQVPSIVRDAVVLGVARSDQQIQALRALAVRARDFAVMDFEFLYDKSRRLLSIGKNIVDGRLDQSFYDLLASEARLASYIAIAQGQLNQDHWFSLGRSLTTSSGIPALLSWSGSMFEYLMPLLIMPSWPRTLLDETYRGVVKRQIEYGADNNLPWGVSESGYNKTDAQQNFQYRAFGVPGLGYKRGLAEDLVVAPYASVMALMVDPIAACANLRRLQSEGRLTNFGFYEAIDYTAARMPPGKVSVVVRSFMAHHQGMSMLSLAYLLLDQPMQRRFLADPAMHATELLLQERVPKTVPIDPHPAEVSSRPAATA